MDWLEDVLAPLAASASWGYHQNDQCATEPAAYAAMALCAHGREAAARRALDWLASRQQPDGTLGVEQSQQDPHWATGLAALAWQTAESTSTPANRYAGAIERAVKWMLASSGVSIERGDWKGHDTTLRGWPWVEGTHSWLEPTAINLLALEKTGHGDHARAREAARMLSDRLLPSGGCNYGNTIVFGQELRAHLQPTGMCLVALANRTELAARLAPSFVFLERELSATTTTISLCYSLLGLAAWKRAPTEAEAWLAAAARRMLARDRSSYKLSLVALAAMGPDCPLIPRAASTSSTN